MPYATTHPPGGGRTMSSLIFHASIIGVSIVSVVGIFKSWVRHRNAQMHTEKRLLEDIVGLTHAIEKKEREIKSLRDRLHVVSTEVVDKGKTISGLEKQVEEARQLVADKEKSVQRYEERNELLNNELAAVREATANGKIQHTDASSQSSPREETRPDLATSLGMDRHTITDVINMLKTLNAEILQLAASMAQYFAFQDIPPDSDDEGEDREEAERQAAEVLGERMVVLLRQGNNNRDQTLLRFTFQACMSAFSDWMASSWYFEDPDSEQVLTRIYDKIRESEEQVVAGRWRVLTRTHVQSMIHNKPDISEYFLDAFSNILVAIGFSGSQARMQNIINSEFGGRMEKIGHLALELNKAIGEGIVSSEIEPIYVAPGVAFDPSVMDDDEQCANSVEGALLESENILCTTELGLLWTVEGSGQNRWDEKILLRPRIVRQSRMQEIS